jgi:hypothetical protein
MIWPVKNVAPHAECGSARSTEDETPTSGPRTSRFPNALRRLRQSFYIDSIVSGGRHSSCAELAGVRLVGEPRPVDVPLLFLEPPSVTAMCARAQCLTLLNASRIGSGSASNRLPELPVPGIKTSTDVLARTIEGFRDWPCTVSR